MRVTDWLLLILLGGLAGAVGQLARMVVGLKKVNDVADATNTSTRELIEPARIVTSIAIGFAAGALAAIATVDSGAELEVKQVLALAAAGYAGTDFIEGFIKREPALVRQVGPTGQASVVGSANVVGSADDFVG